MATLAQLSPWVRYDSQESYLADSAGALTDRIGNRLARRDGTVIAATDARRGPAPLNLDFLGARTYLDGQKATRSDYVDATGKDYVRAACQMHGRPEYADRVHGHEVTDEHGTRWLQYWFFYYYNDKSLVGFGVHEGDWEGIQIRVDADGTPEVVTYAQHDGGERALWSEVEIDPAAQAPMVYVGLGSHASYLRKGSHSAPLVDDVCDAGGRRLRPELEILTDAAPGWVRWPGRWGASAKSGLISFPSPGSPRTQKRWRKPDDFHKDARRFKTDRAGVRTMSKPPPLVTASRTGDTIDVQVTGADVTAKLVITATVDGRPRALEYDLNELPAGKPVPVRPIVAP
jgi:hypothetical protein